MRAICLEVRDRMTFIPVMAVDTTTDYFGNYIFDEWFSRKYLLHRAGYSADGSTIIVVNLNDCRASNESYGWGGSRTMTVAHEYIERNWSSLKDGDVIDVEFILGETTQKKISERLQP